MELNAETPERMGENVADSVVKIVIAVVFPFVYGVFEKPFSGETERLQHPMFRFELGPPNLRIIFARINDFSPDMPIMLMKHSCSGR